MIIKYSHTVGILGVLDKTMEASCVVRNELGIGKDERPLHIPEQVIYAMTGNRYDKIPYMPRPFPCGIWQVFMPQERKSKFLAPYYIPTNAKQYCDVWELDAEGGYKQVTFDKVLDHGYGLHFSESRTTLGCIKIHTKDDLVTLVGLIRATILQNQVVTIEVTE